MATFAQRITRHRDLSTSAQKSAGKAIEGPMEREHATFLTTIIRMLDRKEIDSSHPEGLLNRSVYETLPEAWKDKTNLALLNITQQLRMIEEFYRSTQTPNSSPHLQTMIEQLWQMKERVESEGYDVFKF